MASKGEIEGLRSTVIAVNRDRNSHCAVKWAVEHLLEKNSCCTLIHVRTNTLHPHDFDAVPKQGRPPTEEELHQFFLPFRGFCARKGIVAKELVLHDIDVPSALTYYIIDNSITNVVVGASRWNILIRKFKDRDVPTSLVRSVPESCTVHVVSKGKVQNIRPVPRSQNITATKSLKDISSPKANSLSLSLSRKLFKNGNRQVSSNDGVSSPSVSNNGDASPRISTERSSSSSNPSSLASDSSNICRTKSSINSSKNVETESRKLKLETKRSTKNGSKACKEAVTAKQKATELEKLRQEEQNKEKAMVAEEATLTLTETEVEKQKTKEAMESSAEMSKGLAEIKTKEKDQTETRTMQEEKERKRAQNTSEKNKVKFRIYNIKEIEVATNYFDIALKVGEGGYGPVFRGVIDHTVVAIKALRPDLTRGEKQFHQEVNVLRTIRHPNMVELIGACPEYGCLVYNFVENGTLEDRLFQKDNTPPIPWKIRFKIASEIATGLLFLHQTKPEPIVHRDLKPANILLDRNYTIKITDVGLARLVPPSIANKTTQYHKTVAAGTFCYIDPEYQQTGLLGVKSDIFSLGVVLLQIITGKSPMGVARLVEEAIENGTFEQVLDQNVTDWPIEESLSYARLALKCCEMRKRDRPDLASVILPQLIRLRNLGNEGNSIDIVPES